MIKLKFSCGEPTDQTIAYVVLEEQGVMAEKKPAGFNVNETGHAVEHIQDGFVEGSLPCLTAQCRSYEEVERAVAQLKGDLDQVLRQAKEKFATEAAGR